MQFEKFRGHAMYYVTEYSASKAKQAEAVAEIERIAKTKRGSYHVVTCWVRRNVGEWDLLQLEPDKGYMKMMAVVRR